MSLSGAISLSQRSDGRRKTSLSLLAFVISWSLAHHLEQGRQSRKVEGPRKSSSRDFVSRIGKTKQKAREAGCNQASISAAAAAAFNCNPLQSYQVRCLDAAAFPSALGGLSLSATFGHTERSSMEAGALRAHCWSLVHAEGKRCSEARAARNSPRGTDGRCWFLW